MTKNNRLSEPDTVRDGGHKWVGCIKRCSYGDLREQGGGCGLCSCELAYLLHMCLLYAPQGADTGRTA